MSARRELMHSYHIVAELRRFDGAFPCQIAHELAIARLNGGAKIPAAIAAPRWRL